MGRSYELQDVMLVTSSPWASSDSTPYHEKIISVSMEIVEDTEFTEIAGNMKGILGMKTMISIRNMDEELIDLQFQYIEPSQRLSKFHLLQPLKVKTKQNDSKHDSGNAPAYQ